MKQLSLTQRKWLKSIHLLSAGVWVTTGLVMLIIQFIDSDSKSGDQLHLLHRIIYFIDMKILVPAAMVCLLTGWIYSQFTKWGYFKHGWLTFKWIITILVILLGTFLSGPWISNLVQLSGDMGLDALSNADYQWYNLSHNILGVCMNVTLIMAVFISVFKPWKSKQKSRY